jgi:dTDP-4-amino-4,6-dideoxygalactose transaminase
MTVQAQAVSFFMHDLGQLEMDAIAKVFAGPILTTGSTVAEFEKQFSRLLDCKHTLGVTSCTGALHMSLLALGIGPGDEVITTPMTFIATSTAILEAGATPVFVDVEVESGNIDANLIESAITNKTKAILPVHLFGQMCDMKSIRRIADRHGLFVIEDAAHCVEGERDGIRPGQLGDTACFSFYATKNLTCGEGGAVVTNSDDLYEKLLLLRTHGMTKTAADRSVEGYKHWDMKVLGWKYNMDNIQAAILLPQIARLPEASEKREILANYYAAKLEGIADIIKPTTFEGSRHARHLYPIWITNGKRDYFIEQLQRRGVGVMVNYRAIHLLTYFKEKLGLEPGSFPIAENIGESTISLPFYPAMPFSDVDIVASALRDIAN